MKILTGCIIVLAVLVAWQHHEINVLTENCAGLTTRLDDATRQLNTEIERGHRIEQATIRLERADAERQADLRKYERDLLGMQDPALDAVVPDSALRGLRSCPIAGPRCDP